MDIPTVEVGYREIDIPFDAIDRDYGRAEFTLCLRPAQWWLYTVQQRVKGAWHGLYRKKNHFMICSFENLDEPHVWSTHWCSTHRTACIAIYVPDGSSQLHIDSGGFSFWP